MNHTVKGYHRIFKTTPNIVIRFLRLMHNEYKNNKII
jgi:hypothetical protein